MTDDQHDYDDEPIPRSSRARWDISTSHLAGESLSAEMMGRQHYIILETIRKYGPGTMHDITNHCELDLESVHKRLPEIGEKGKKWLYRPGETAVGPSGRKCKIWHEDLRPRNSDGTLVEDNDDDEFGPGFRL